MHICAWKKYNRRDMTHQFEDRDKFDEGKRNYDKLIISGQFFNRERYKDEQQTRKSNIQIDKYLILTQSAQHRDSSSYLWKNARRQEMIESKSLERRVNPQITYSDKLVVVARLFRISIRMEVYHYLCKITFLLPSCWQGTHFSFSNFVS